jgi:hypothetical protein
MNEALQKAIDCLRIRDVYLHSSNTSLEDGFEPKYDPDLDKLEVQFKHIVTRSSVLELIQDNRTINLFRVFVALGTRWIIPCEEKNGDDDPEVKAHIEGVMVAEYLMQADPAPDALKQFALKNASFHIWPYWREYLSTQCLRMNLPKLIMPAVQFASGNNSN